MTALLVVIGVTLLACSVWLALRAAALPRLKLDAHLREIGSYGFKANADGGLVLEGRHGDASLTRLAEAVGRFTASRIPALAPVPRGELTAAGIYKFSADAVHGYRLLAAGAGCAVGLAYVVLLTHHLTLIGLLVVSLATALGWYGPSLSIRQRARDRRSKIDRELPDLIDLLVATVEAGLGLAGSLRLVAGRFHGPLGDELRLTLQQQSLGISNDDALNDLVDRVGTPSIRSFARTVMRAETMGTSIGPIMRNLSAEIRRRRRQDANERVQKTPIKMLFPLVFLIFPALFIILLYPALYTILHELGG